MTKNSYFIHSKEPLKESEKRFAQTLDIFQIIEINSMLNTCQKHHFIFCRMQNAAKTFRFSIPPMFVQGNGALLVIQPLPGLFSFFFF